MFRAWDDAVRVLTGRPTGSKVTGEVFDVLENDGRSVQHLYRSNQSDERPSSVRVVRDDEHQAASRSKRTLQ